MVEITDRLSNAQAQDRVTKAQRSEKDKNNGRFAKALEEMLEDELEDGRHDKDADSFVPQEEVDQQDQKRSENAEPKQSVTTTDEDTDSDPPEHIDLTA